MLAVIEWVAESGDATADARYLASLYGMSGGVALRRRELTRLARLHGEGHRFNVERLMKEAGAGEVPSAPIDPRLSAVEAIAEMRRTLGMTDDHHSD